MKEQRTIYLLNEDEIEDKIIASFDHLDIDEASELLKDIDIDDMYLDQQDMKEIKERTTQKLGLVDIELRNESKSNEIEQRKIKRGFTRWIKYAIASVAVVISIIVVINHGSIVQAFHNMIRLIPGVGIVEDNNEVGYQLKKAVSVKKGLNNLEILYVTAIKDRMEVRFKLDVLFTQEQIAVNKKKKDKNHYLNVYILSDGKKYQSHNIISGGSSEYTSSYDGICNFTIDSKYIRKSKEYTLVCEDYNISVNFKLVAMEQYNKLSDIGDTEVHNNISLTATAFRKDKELYVNVYPINNSDYNLVSFNEQYDLEYFGKKMTLRTDHGDKEYTAPHLWGTGINSPYTFDISDGSRNFKLSIPFVAVSTNEEKEITLPIPKEGKEIELNKEVVFKDGSLIIKSVEKPLAIFGGKYGLLNIKLDYKSLDKNKQLVGVELTSKADDNWNEDRDEQNRVKTISYALRKSDKDELKLYAINPRYLLMDPYQLEINVK